MPLKSIPKKILAVRGPLTRNFLLKNGVDCPPIYGDPALLLPLFYKPYIVKKYKLGVVPHISDQDNCFLQSLMKEHPDVLVVDMKNYTHWQDVVNQICSCDFIISSSLHGLIISDAYAIPNVWVEFSNKIIGNRFKFRDYFASVGRTDTLPYEIKKAIELEEIRKKILSWKPIQFDLNTLWDACPFKKTEK